jgi:glycosyltransferase involved in cell wall biosynthesis
MRRLLPVPTDNSPAPWICCQLGAREHYAVPRALHRQGRLAQLITDAWMPPGSPLHALPGERSRRLRERYHPELAGRTTDLTWSLIGHELLWSAQGRRGWDLFMTRNHWFQARAAAALAAHAPAPRPIVFANSYAALEIFKTARTRGWRCILGQIDPGARHFEIVSHTARQAPEYGPPPMPPPAAYLEQWREECALADRIVVNSDWSRRCLEEAHVPAIKLTIAPLAYEADRAEALAHEYPDRFTRERPLRLLFVGQATVAKGIKPLLEATALLAEAPITLTIVGERSATIPAQFTADPRIRWIGAVSRSDVMEHYRAADVLIFPSHSDGFGMAQIEAQGWRLPIIASASSGRVVADGVNGILLDAVTPDAIAAAVRRLIADPRLLESFSCASGLQDEQGLAALGRALVALEDA